eukprot:gene5818-6514_t
MADHVDQSSGAVNSQPGSSKVATSARLGTVKSVSRKRVRKSTAALVSEARDILKQKKKQKITKPYTRVTSYHGGGRVLHNQAKRKKKKPAQAKEISASCDPASCSLSGFEERSYTSDLICQNETNESNDGLNDIIEECRILIGNAKDSTWSKRQKLCHVKWGENREKIMETLLKEQFLEDKSVNDAGRIVEIKKFVDIKVPFCQSCGFEVDEISIESTGQECIVVNLQGRYDLLKPKYHCDYCNEDIDVFTCTSLIRSGYWPGSMGNISYIFDEQLFIFWDKLKSFMPGTSESAFLRSLEDISMDRNRQGTVNKTAFAQCYKEWKFCHMQTEVMQMKNLFECPSCSIQQHSSHVDGNCKLYRYKSSGKYVTKKTVLLWRFIFCDDKLVDNALQIIYNNPDIGRISILSGGLWMEDSGFTPGEEDEQIFSYLSRIGGTTKYMLPERREEAITEHAAAWNKRKLDNFILNLRKRYQHILEKQKKVQEEQCQKLQKCPCPITVDMYEDWKREAVLNAEEKAKLPDIGDHVCVVEDVIPMKLSILRLKVFSKSLDALQRRYCTLNERFFTNEDSVLENTEENILNVYESIFSAHQRRIEATAYSILHMTNNLNKLAASSELKHDLLVLNLTVRRLAEELVLIRTEMRNTIWFFKEKKLKSLESHLKELSDLLEKESEHEASSGVQSEEGSPDVVKGKMALVSRGINYCKLQLQSACKVFSTCIDRSTAAEPDVAFETCHNDAVSYSDDDAEFFEEDSSEFRDLAELSDASLSDSDNEDLYF